MVRDVQSQIFAHDCQADQADIRQFLSSHL
jgi:hypothetical protein